MMPSKLMMIVLFLAFVGLALLSGCGGGSHVVSRSNFIDFTGDQLLEIENSERDVYKVQEGDVFTLAFTYLDNLDQDVVIILPDGSANLVGVDRVELAGLTIAEADSVITYRYSREYRNPDLSLILLETKGRRVYVLGEVDSPGLHELPQGGLDIMGAIAVAGGFTDDAAKEGSVLVRVTDKGYLCQEIDLSGFHSIEYVQLAMINLQPYDVIYVPRSRIGDFSYFSQSVLAGLMNMTRIAADLKYLTGGIGRY